jgi:hypothetical protein
MVLVGCSEDEGWEVGGEIVVQGFESRFSAV